MPIPGMKWSTVLLVASIGMRVTADQCTPSVEVLYTKSLLEHLERKRQSCHTVQILPAPSCAAEGSGRLRRPPASVCACTLEMVTSPDQLAPPLVEVNADSPEVSMGCTSGCPPSPVPPVPTTVAADQVKPPSVDVFIIILSALLGLSHSI